MKRIPFLAAAALALLLPSVASAQVDSSRAILLLGEYGVSRIARVIVLPMNFPGGDSIRAIIQRDFDNGNRIEVIRHADSLALPTRDSIDYGPFTQMRADGLVLVVPTDAGIRVTLFDVNAKRSAGFQDFALPPRSDMGEWRWALHGVSDEVHEWIVRVKGIAQTRIAFVRGGSLYTVDSDGANERMVERGNIILSPDWHPLQPTIVFSAFNGSAWRIGAKSLSGSQTQWLTTNASGSNGGPVFSHDGRDVFFQRTDGPTSAIWTVPFGSQPATARSIKANTWGKILSSPTPSPRGDRIMYVSNELGNPTLFMMASDGTNSAAFVVPPGDANRTYLEAPAWAPNGDRYVYQVRRGQDAKYQIEIADIRTKSGKLVTDLGENQSPSWSPDSRHIVIESTRTGTSQLFVIDTESNRSRQLTFGQGGAKTPAWSPRYK